MNDFDLITCPLSGTHCISAGAGTGKTYAISHLFLRLLLEKQYSVDAILVVTFTEAATKELRDRIRRLIKKALDIFSGKEADDTITAIVNSHGNRHSSALTKAILYEALYRFDEAPICTIHSFCNRILRDNAFESNMRFDTELITEQEPLILETVRDFWRKNFYSASPFLINFARSNGWTPQKFYNLLANHPAQPDLEITPKQEFPDASRAEQSFTSAFEAVSKAWPEAKTEISDILSNNDSLHKNKYKKEKFPSLINALDAFLAYNADNPGLFNGFIKFTSREIRNATRKNMPTPEHEFFELCDALYECSLNLNNLLEQQLVALKYECFKYVCKNLEGKKLQGNIYTFDDLLTNLYNALQGQNRKTLISSIRKKFKAALIDEFQDTDPIQYAIFKPLFAEKGIPLFLIGDPKQAIYSFRGADIFTFMEAVDNTPDKNLHTLRTNRRSGKNLIHAFNTIFQYKPDPFIYKSIPYFEAVKPKDTSSCNIAMNGKTSSPLTIWYLSSTRFSIRKDKESRPYPITKEHATAILCRAVTRQIAGLLMQGMIVDAESGKKVREIKPQDIAVLVRTGRQAREIKEALSSEAIPAVLHKTGNIFDTIDAREICHILHAAAHPHNHSYIKTALCTSLIGMNANSLFDAVEQGPPIEYYYDEFREYHDLWSRYGFIRMFNAFINRRHVRKKLLSMPDGERRLTNILHIQELLQQQSTENHLTMSPLLKWFSGQLNPDSPRLEEHELRLEKDDNAVQIVTIHKSKGLQYPIVFCPFTWGDSRVSDNEFIYHDENNRRIYEIGSPEYDEHKKSAERELLAENLRLLYVAITRARYRCYLAWGRFNKAETSAPAYLFHKPDTWNTASTVPDLGRQVQTLSDNEMLNDLNRLSSRSNGSLEIIEYEEKSISRYKPETEIPDKLACRTFQGTIPSGKRLSSFSSLIHQKHEIAELRDIEESYIMEEPVSAGPEGNELPEKKSIFTFPKGAESGTLLHIILEQLDFSEENNKVTSDIINQELIRYGYEPGWHDAVNNTIKNLFALNMKNGRDSFRLSSIPMVNTSREMEFYYPVQNITPKKLSAIFEESDISSLIPELPQRIGSLDFQPARGYMHGFIDLLFTHNNRYYIIDWKSNFLGDSADFYSEENLKQAMLNNSYFLQYYIYALAIDRYLASRIKDYSYDNHFGGVYYIFLRGISEDRNSRNGIFFDKPENNIINKLNIDLIDK